LLILPLAGRSLHLPALAADRAFGWDPRVGTLFAVTGGYFMWDSIVCLVHYEGVGFLVHGWACLTVYLNGFRPIFAYYGPRFLLWELSTPFLNIHWMLDKTGQTGSPLQFVNGLILLATFAGARLVYGSVLSYQFYQTIFEARDGLSSAIFVGYLLGNLVMNGLNVYWFMRMIVAIRKRFDTKNTKTRPPSHYKNVADTLRTTTSESNRALMRRSEEKRRQKQVP